MNKKKMTLIETFSGAGMQRRGLSNSNVFDIESVATCETDANAIICYAAIHEGLTPELVESYTDYPSREDMAKELSDMRINYDFVKDKEYNWDKVARSKDSKNQLKNTWLACKLSRNTGDIARVQQFPKAGMLTFSFPCFVEGTLVFTKDGYKEIQDIEVGDYVLTHTNKWQRVSKTMVNEANSLISINCMPSEKIHCTPNHPFYVRKKNNLYDSVTGKRWREFDIPEWIEAKNLTRDYYVGTAINTIEKIPEWNGFNKKTSWGHTIQENTLSDKFNMPEFWYIIGRYIGDGWVRNQAGIIICANQEEVGQLYPYLDKLGWGYSVVEERTCIKIHIPFQEIGAYCSQFGKGASNKHLTSDILNLPCDLLKSFLEGYMDSDGCFTQNKYKLTSVSRELIYETAQCIMKVYKKPVSVYFVKRKAMTMIEGRIVNQKDQYQLTFKPDITSQSQAFYEDGYIWSPIKETNIEEYNGLVYNLEVENDNSYMVQNVICHNCTDLSVAGKQKGMEEGETRSGLVWEVIRILKNMKNGIDDLEPIGIPNFLLMENVDALINKKNIGSYQRLNKCFEEELGYKCVYKVLNTKELSYDDVPTPQNRKRVYALYYQERLEDKVKNFEFPTPFDAGIRLKDVLYDDVAIKYYVYNDKVIEMLQKLIDNRTLEEQIEIYEQSKNA